MKVQWGLLCSDDIAWKLWTRASKRKVESGVNRSRPLESLWSPGVFLPTAFCPPVAEKDNPPRKPDVLFLFGTGSKRAMLCEGQAKDQTTTRKMVIG